jgi:protein transport protein SEC24
LSAYTQIVRPQAGQLLVPYSLRLLPLFTHSLLNCVGLRSGISTTLDQRTFSLLQLKAAPLVEEMMTIYPYFYAVHNIQRAPESDDGVPQLDRLHLSYEQIEKGGVYLLEGAFHMILYVTEAVSPVFCQDVLGVGSYNQILDRGMELPELENEASIKLRSFIANRYSLRPLHPLLEVFDRCLNRFLISFFKFSFQVFFSKNYRICRQRSLLYFADNQRVGKGETDVYTVFV